MVYTEHYNNLVERKLLCDQANNNGYTMRHDDFDPDWIQGTEPHGTLTFDLPTPPTAGEVYQEQLEAEFNDAHTKEIAALKKGIKNLKATEKDALLELLIKKDLYRDGHLKLGVLE